MREYLSNRNATVLAKIGVIEQFTMRIMVLSGVNKS